ncbi:MAG: glycosyltransferase family 4 protein [Pseudonocardiaceae bacterium]
MRVIVHDYSGHPFQVQLSRKLARRGHQVLHVHCVSYETGKGAVARRAQDPASFAVEGIDLGRPFDRYSWARRIRQELAYGRAFTRTASRFRPDVILSSNDPLFAKVRAAQWCRRVGTPWVFWLQDLYSVAMSGYAGGHMGSIGKALGWGFRRAERALLHQAAGVVSITADFLPVLQEWGVDARRCSVIENWAPLDEIEPRSHDNAWAREHGLNGKRVVLYSGTLGLKHDPGMLLEMAVRGRGDPDLRVVVISQGLGAKWLVEERARLELKNLMVLDYQPYERLAEVLATADVLLALLTSGAGVFSAPSKVLTYLCAGRPIVAAMPRENLGARRILEAEAGIVVEPHDAEAFAAAVESLLADSRLSEQYGRQARVYAEQAFDVEPIADRFEQVLASAASSSG